MLDELVLKNTSGGEECHMFSVDYPTLEQIIRQFMHTGIFRAQVIKSRFLPDDGYVDLQAKEGVVIACRFVTKQGQVYVWDRWNAELARIGVLNWEQIPDNAMPLRSSPTTEPLSRQTSGALPVQSRSSIPHHTNPVDASQMQQLPTLYRRVYYLVDGKRRFSDIALMLHKPEQEIVQVIHALIRQGLLTLQ